MSYMLSGPQFIAIVISVIVLWTFITYKVIKKDSLTAINKLLLVVLLIVVFPLGMIISSAFLLSTGKEITGQKN